MKKLFFLLFLYSNIHCINYLKNFCQEYNVVNTYTVTRSNDRIFVNGPDGYFGIGIESNGHYFYNSSDNAYNTTYGHGFQSGNTYYYNEYR